MDTPTSAAGDRFLYVMPVLPSADIERDLQWYEEKLGMAPYHHDDMYAVLYRDDIVIHLQWHADTADDPLGGGSVIRIRVRNARAVYEECVSRGAVAEGKFIEETPWRTREFGFFDLNGNAIFIMEDITE